MRFMVTKPEMLKTVTHFLKHHVCYCLYKALCLLTKLLSMHLRRHWSFVQYTEKMNFCFWQCGWQLFVFSCLRHSRNWVKQHIPALRFDITLITRSARTYSHVELRYWQVLVEMAHGADRGLGEGLLSARCQSESESPQRQLTFTLLTANLSVRPWAVAVARGGGTRAMSLEGRHVPRISPRRGPPALEGAPRLPGDPLGDQGPRKPGALGWLQGPIGSSGALRVTRDTWMKLWYTFFFRVNVLSIVWENIPGPEGPLRALREGPWPPCPPWVRHWLSVRYSAAATIVQQLWEFRTVQSFNADVAHRVEWCAMSYNDVSPSARHTTWASFLSSA